MNIYEIPAISSRIAGNPYVGRGIVTGTSPDGRAVTAYFIMGRSRNSRNRIFVKKGEEVFTEPFDASLVEDPSLIIYAAVRRYENHLFVTNGDQTDTAFEAAEKGVDFFRAMEQREFEPDAPNFTPRISAEVEFSGASFLYRLSILKSIDAEGSACARYGFTYPSQKGLGHFLHTYVTDGNPIPTFQGEPERVAIPDDIDAFTEEIWDNLNNDNKISLYVRYTDPETGKFTDRLVNKN